jgi:hypothetical protein
MQKTHEKLHGREIQARPFLDSKQIPQVNDVAENVSWDVWIIWARMAVWRFEGVSVRMLRELQQRYLSL